jgi:hypothetical protein
MPLPAAIRVCLIETDTDFLDPEMTLNRNDEPGLFVPPLGAHN